MSPEFIPKLFEPFEQEKNSALSANNVGSGLGMAITRRLVGMMGGRIEVESAVRAGTVMTVYLNFEKCGGAEEGPAADASQHGLPPGKRILMCEDNEVNTLVARRMLEKTGCIVECAANGKQGLDMFQASAQNYYDAVLMDIRMPVMDGIQATGEIRALDRADAKTVPILALTANAFDNDIQACIKAGMNAHIAKPIVPQNLYAELRRFLRSREQGDF